MKNKLAILIAVFTIASIFFGGYLIIKKQNQFVVIVDEHDRLELSPDIKKTTDFIQQNIQKNTFILADNQTGQAKTIEKLDRVKVILTDEVQKDFSIIYQDDEMPIVNSSIDVEDNKTLLIKIFINDDSIKNSGDGDWYFTSHLAQNIYYIRDLTTYSQVLPPEIYQRYNQTIPVSDVSSLLQSGVRFAEITK